MAFPLGPHGRGWADQLWGWARTAGDAFLTGTSTSWSTWWRLLLKHNYVLVCAHFPCREERRNKMGEMLVIH